eukprot:gene18586-20451_t
MASKMKHIKESGIDFGPRLAHRYTRASKQAVSDGTWKQLWPEWFLDEKNVPRKQRDATLVEFISTETKAATLFDAAFKMSFSDGAVETESKISFGGGRRPVLNQNEEELIVVGLEQCAKAEKALKVNNIEDAPDLAERLHNCDEADIYKKLDQMEQAMEWQKVDGWRTPSLKTGFVKHYVKWATDFRKPCILFPDGHGSRLTYKVVESALANKIIMICLPPHTSHALQPCDVALFRPLKVCWKDVLKSWSRVQPRIVLLQEQPQQSTAPDTQRKLLREAIISAITPSPSEQTKNAMMNSKKKRKRVQELIPLPKNFAIFLPIHSTEPGYDVAHLTRSEQVIEACVSNDIVFATLPPNSKHLCRTLNVAVFGPAKKAWKEIIGTWRKESRVKRNNSKGMIPQGTIPQGTSPQGTSPQGTSPQGTSPQGTSPQGTSPQGTSPQGTIPYDAVKTY